MTTGPYFPALTLFAVLCSATAASAQSAGPVEAIGPDGAVVEPASPLPALTPAQRSAVYNTASRRSIRADAGQINAEVGAWVPPSLALGALPQTATATDESGNVLKYATVGADVAVIDPIRMSVVDVIHSGVGP